MKELFDSFKTVNTMVVLYNSLVRTKTHLWILTFFFLMIVFEMFESGARQATASIKETTQTKVYHSSDFGWKANQDVTETFAQLLESGELKAGVKLILDHKYRISGSHTLPDNFTLSAVKEAGFDVINAANPKNNRPLLELSNDNTLHNLTITYLNTPPLGPTGEEHGVTFTKRLGIQGHGIHHLRIENCRLRDSIGHCFYKRMRIFAIH